MQVFIDAFQQTLVVYGNRYHDKNRPLSGSSAFHLFPVKPS